MNISYPNLFPTDGFDMENYSMVTSVTFGALVTAIGVATVVGNFMLLLVIIRTRQLHTITNVFIGSLAVADLIMGVAVMPFTATSWLTRTWIFGEGWCQATAFFRSMTDTATGLNLAMVSLDRCFAITRPLRYNLIMTPYSTLCMITYVWVHSLVFSSFPLFGWGTYRFSTTTGICTIDPSSSISFTIVERTFNGLLPGCILTGVFIRILKEAHMRHKRIFVALPVPWPVNAQGQTAPNYKRTTIRAMRTLFVIVFALAILCLPYHIANILSITDPDKVPAIGKSVFVLIMLASSAINPVLITLLNNKFSERFNNLMCGKCVKRTATVNISALEASVAVHHTNHTQSTYLRSDYTASAIGGTSMVVPEVSTVIMENSGADTGCHDNDHHGKSKTQQLSHFEEGESSGVTRQDLQNTRDKDKPEDGDEKQRTKDKDRKHKKRPRDRQMTFIPSSTAQQMNPNLLMPPGPVPDLAIPAFYRNPQEKDDTP